MCGIFAVTGSEDDSVELIYKSLRKLAYRGYDSAGIASVMDTGDIKELKTLGHPEELKFNLLKSKNASIGHNRWATHGGITLVNTHPHYSSNGDIAVVHNGIIDNYEELKKKYDIECYSQTDTEIIPKLIEKFYTGSNELEAIKKTIDLLDGTFALAIIFSFKPSTVWAAKRGSPLAIGHEEGWKNWHVSSDATIFGRNIVAQTLLEENEIVELTAGKNIVSNNIGPRVFKDNIENEDKDDAGCAMRREIFEQEESIKRAIWSRIRFDESTTYFNGIGNFPIPSRIVMIACGSSYNAALYGKYLIEEKTNIPVEVTIASELSYIDDKATYFVLSQSGETYDVIAAVKEIKRKGVKELYAIVNRVGSTIATMCSKGIYLHAGKETAVAATKSFTAQCIVLHGLAIHLARRIDKDSKWGNEELSKLRSLSYSMVMAEFDNSMVQHIYNSHFLVILGSGPNYALALEGALKIKEICYIPCETAPVGEIKHGPLALISHNTPVIILGKHPSTASEVAARGGKVYTFNDNLILPNIFQLQLLTMELAEKKGLNIDRPRNLAKCVTTK